MTGQPSLTSRRGVLAGAAVGLALALAAFTPGFILGTGPAWTWPRNDHNQYLFTWHYFLHQPWGLPLFDLPDMGYPQGGSALLTDGLPLGLLPSKLVHTLTGAAVNPLGWWMLACYVLLGAFSARLLALLGVGSTPALAAGAFLALTRPFFMWRVGHISAASHFLIVWAACLYVRDVGRGVFGWREHLVLAVVAMFLQPYLVVMVALIQALTVLHLMVARQLGPAGLARVALIVAAVVAVGAIQGYGAMFTGPGTMRGEGFGVYSWNPLSSIVPPPQLWGDWGMVREATGGQYEGEGYLGAGVWVILLAALAAPRLVWRLTRQHWALAAGVALCLAFAVSHRVHVGPYLVAELPLPESVLSAASLFRASGRFVWVPAYLLALFGLAIVVRAWPRRLAVAVVAMAVAVQSVEAVRLARDVRAYTATGEATTFDVEQMRAWMAAHARVFQFPSYTCGGLVPGRQFPDADTHRELHIQLIAARLGRPINGVYTSRQLKDCQAEQAWAAQPRLEADVLYLLGTDTAARFAALRAFMASSACRDVGYATVCSVRFTDEPVMPRVDRPASR